MTERSAHKPGPSGPASTRAAAPSGQDPLAPLQLLGTAWAEAMGAMGGEVAQFMARRLSEDIKTQHAILNCASPGDLAAIQGAFVQTAVAQYSAETGKMLDLGNRLMADMAKATRS